MSSAAQGLPAEPRGAASAALEIVHALAVASPIGLALFDGATFSVRWTNGAYLALLDEPYRTAGVVGLRLEAFAPSARVMPGLLAAVSATGRPERLEELEYRGLARGVTTWQATLRPVERGAGQARDVLLALVEVTDQVAARRRAELAARQAHEAEQAAQRGVDRLARLLEITAALAAVRTQAEVAGALFDGAWRSVGAVTGLLLVPCGPGLLEVAAARGLDQAELEGLHRLPLSAPLPTAAAASRLEPIFLEDLSEAERAFPGLARLPSLRSKAQALVALPLRLGQGELRGALGLGFQGPHPFEPGERAFLLALAEQGAQALERAHLLDALRREQDRLALSQELTSALSSAQTVAGVAAAVFEKGLLAFGARAGMLALHQDGLLRVEHLFGYQPAQAEAFRTIDPSAPVAVAEVFRTGQPVWVESRAEMARRYPVLAGRLDEGHGAWAALPLPGQDGPMGVLGLSFVEERGFDDGEQALAVSLARKCAQALERARLYESERAARAEAERASALQERLMAIVGHDLRTPLAAITLSAQSMQRRGLGEQEAAAVARVASSAARMAGIIRDLLDFARIRQGQSIPVRLARLRADELCRRVVGELKVAHPGAAIEEAYQGPLELLGDAGRLQQVLANLLGNAVQHGGGQPVRVAVQREGDEVVLSVQNGGPPIDPAFLPRIFEPFRQGDGRGEGIGLGLHIVSEIVRAHGGRVEASSSSEAGTRFTVRLAAAPLAQER